MVKVNLKSERSVRELRLPQWARTELDLLRGKVKELDRKLSEFRGEKETNVVIEDGVSDEIPLIKDSRIAFILYPEHPFASRVVCQIEQNRGEPFLRVSGRGGISIHPEAANSVSIYRR